MTGTLPDLAPDLRAVLERHADRLDLDLIERALRFSASAHRGQKRMSGEDFVSHSIAVALILAEQLLDSATIAAALLHDVVEDSDVRTEDIAREFGGEIAGIVDGLTKISSLTFRSSAEEQVENYRKLLLSIAKDARVIIIKLGDRLHNMRTLEHLPPERRHRIALETREIYAPLAHRFGMAGIKAELEDLAFKFLEPDEYRELVNQVASKRAEREQTILKLRTPLEYELKRAGIDWFEVTGRPKHLWSIFQKMRKRNKAFEEIYDLMAIRVIVRSVPECYHVLGIIHHNWTPIQERIKDYIASPKSNAYQSLHTTIFGPGGQLFEVQIRTQEMHRTAEFGIAAHWLYKRDGKPGRARPAPRLVPPAARAAAGHPQPRGVPRVPEGRPLPGRDLHLHAAGRREAAAQGRPPRSTSRSTCTPRSGSSARAPRSTAGSRRCTGSSRAATRSRSSPAPAPSPAATG